MIQAMRRYVTSLGRALLPQSAMHAQTWGTSNDCLISIRPAYEPGNKMIAMCIELNLKYDWTPQMQWNIGQGRCSLAAGSHTSSITRLGSCLILGSLDHDPT